MQDRDFGVALALGYQVMVRELHAELARHGLTGLGSSYGYILRTVEAGPLNQRQLAERLDVSDQAIGKVVTASSTTSSSSFPSRRSRLRRRRSA